MKKRNVEGKFLHSSSSVSSSSWSSSSSSSSSSTTKSSGEQHFATFDVVLEGTDPSDELKQAADAYDIEVRITATFPNGADIAHFDAPRFTRFYWNRPAYNRHEQRTGVWHVSRVKVGGTVTLSLNVEVASGTRTGDIQLAATLIDNDSLSAGASADAIVKIIPK